MLLTWKIKLWFQEQTEKSQPDMSCLVLSLQILKESLSNELDVRLFKLINK